LTPLLKASFAPSQKRPSSSSSRRVNVASPIAASSTCQDPNVYGGIVCSQIKSVRAVKALRIYQAIQSESFASADDTGVHYSEAGIHAVSPMKEKCDREATPKFCTAAALVDDAVSDEYWLSEESHEVGLALVHKMSLRRKQEQQEQQELIG
jgi:hypothetical protein